MDALDGQVPAPRRSGPARFRPLPTAADLSALLPGEDEPRVAELNSLLGDIDALRLTLQTDLTLAAAALEGGAPDLAADLVNGDLAEVRAFAARAAGHLARLDDATAPEHQPADEIPVAVPVRRRRILSAAPLMAAAAALIGFVAFVPSRGGSVPETTMTSMTSATIASYELDRLAAEGAPDELLRQAAQQLNAELAMLISQAGDDPAAAQQAMLLLEKTSDVLARQGDSGVLRTVMAETQALRARLREALPVVAQRPVRPVRPVVRAVVPVLPRVQEEPEKERATSPAPQSSPKASPSPSPSAVAPAAPSPSPAPEPSQEPSPEPSPSEQSDNPLPQPGSGDLPGV